MLFLKDTSLTLLVSLCALTPSQPPHLAPLGWTGHTTSTRIRFSSQYKHLTSFALLNLSNASARVNKLFASAACSLRYLPARSETLPEQGVRNLLPE